MHTNMTHESTNTAVVLFHHDTHSTLTQTLRYVTLLPTAFQKFTSSSHSVCFPVDFTRAHTHTHPAGVRGDRRRCRDQAVITGALLRNGRALARLRGTCSHSLSA